MSEGFYYATMIHEYHPKSFKISLVNIYFLKYFLMIIIISYMTTYKYNKLTILKIRVKSTNKTIQK